MGMALKIAKVRIIIISAILTRMERERELELLKQNNDFRYAKCFNNK
jgi:hypothetical protein